MTGVTIDWMSRLEKIRLLWLEKFIEHLDRVAVRLVQNGAFGIGRGEGPGDGQRFRSGKRQIDIADARF